MNRPNLKGKYIDNLFIFREYDTRVCGIGLHLNLRYHYFGVQILFWFFCVSWLKVHYEGWKGAKK